VGEPAAERHRQAEEIEEAFSDEIDRRVERLGILPQQRDVERRRREGGRPRDRAGPCRQPRDFGRSDEARRHPSVRVPRPKRDEIVGMGEGQRPQERRVHRTEDRRRGPDADRQRGDSRQREGRRRRQLPDRVSEILRESIHVVV
jgi:hypothetical protein